MPTYEYICEKCGNHFIRIETMSAHEDKVPSCPKCKSRKVTQLLSAFYAKTAKKS